MKAVVHSTYGSPDVLEIRDVEKPAPKDNEVLIEVRAASVNPLDWHIMRGDPFLVRMMTGLRSPKDTRLGVDVAGVVEAAGRNVTTLKTGDEVFGATDGAFAEYACASESAVVLKPANVTFEEAASVNIAASTAYQALRNKGRIQPGQKVLINGAAGGVGTFAVQIAARFFGAHVTGVCSTRNVDMVRSIGAERVIDYMKEDLTSGGERYDVMLDCIGNHSLSACRRVLNRKGVYIMIGGPSGGWLDPLPRGLHALLYSRFVSQNLVMFLASSNKADLTILRDLLESGTIQPVIDRRYPLSEVPDAIRYLEEGHARGKVVITVGPSGSAA